MAMPSPTMTAAAVDDCPTTPSKSLARTATAKMSSANGPAPAVSSSNSNNIGSVLSAKIDALPRTLQFLSLALCVFFFFGIHNVLQEAMINTEGFTFGVMLGWMEVLGVTLCSAIERSSVPFVGNGEGRRRRMAPWQAYPLLTICLLMSSSLASWSLNYINFPTKVVFRSCKLLPTMVLAYVMGNAKRFTYVEVGSAMAVCAGLITFAAGDWSLSKPRFHPFGLTLVTMSVFADAVLPNAQEKLFRTYDASKSEVMFFTNVYCLVVQTGSALLSGDLMGMFHFVMGRSRAHEVNYFSSLLKEANSTSPVLENDSFEDGGETMASLESGEIRHTFVLYVTMYIFISWIAVSAHTAVVKKFGGVAAVFVGTARKGMTLILSFALFPKESNWRYPAGAALVLGGLTVASLEKQRKRRTVKGDLRKTGNENDGASEGKNGVQAKSIERKGFFPSLPLEGRLGGGNCDGGTSEQQPLINLDAELGHSTSTVSNRPERRR